MLDIPYMGISKMPANQKKELARSQIHPSIGVDHQSSYFLAHLVFQIWLLAGVTLKVRHQSIVFAMRKMRARYMYITMLGT